MSIPFTQFMLPDGKRRQTVIDMPQEIEDKALKLIEAGYRFEIEVLTTGEISMECLNDEEGGMLANELCENGPPVVEAVESLVNRSFERWQT